MSQTSVRDQIHSDALGVIWLTQGPLSMDQKAFYEFNYIFDGLLGEFLTNADKPTLGALNSFYTESFGKTFFLIHINTETESKKKISDLLIDQVSLAGALKNSNKLILTLDETKASWIPELKATFQNFEFKAIDL